MTTQNLMELLEDKANRFAERWDLDFPMCKTIAWAMIRYDVERKKIKADDLDEFNKQARLDIKLDRFIYEVLGR